MDCKAVVGLYGISGSGKSRALSLLRDARPEWCCLEGTQVIEDVLKVRGESLTDFRAMEDATKAQIRKSAIQVIQERRGMTIVSGHCSFPEDSANKEEILFRNVFSEGDGETYDAILYLDRDVDTIYSQRHQDNECSRRTRPDLHVSILKKWILYEKQILENMCKQHGIYFALIPDTEGSECIDDILSLVAEHVLAPKIANARVASEVNLKKVLGTLPSANMYLLIDGDRTLVEQDTGMVFLENMILPSVSNGDPLKQIFQRHPGYNFASFFEVAMYYANIMPTQEYQELSARIGRDLIEIQDQWVKFLDNLPADVHPIIVTSGNREVYEELIRRTPSLARKASLVAGNHIHLHEYLVDSNAKGMVVHELRKLHGGCKILSFGDSSVDIPMLQASDRGYVVIDDRKNRSLKTFIAKHTLQQSPFKSGRLYQLHVGNKNDTTLFYHTGIMVGCLDELRQQLVSKDLYQVLQYAENSNVANLLATQTRRSDLFGPALQDVHRDVGRFLAEKLVDEDHLGHDLVTLKSFSHVQVGTTFDGIVTHDNMVIVPLMRGGEPMSRGVYDYFPCAQLIHDWDNDDKKSHSLLKKALETIHPHHDKFFFKTVVLVDSVVNEGKSIRHTIDQIQSLAQNNEEQHQLRIVVLTAVMQKNASMRLPKEYPRVQFLALRISENKYAGKGGTDTGNRLFGTFESS